MRAPAVSFANKIWALALAALLTSTLVPASALAEGEGDSADAPAEEPQEISAEQADEGSGSTPVASTSEGGTLASALVGAPTTFINSDVALDSEPIVGSFTVDGLTFAVTEGSDVELVGISPDWQQVSGSQEGEGSPVAPMLASGPDGLDTDSSALTLPESVTYEGVDYTVTSIGAYAFYLSGVASVELPASVGSVDDRAFRSSDVALVTVADGNATYSSFDGALYDAAQLSLLLIPEGKQGTVLLPKTAESAASSVFSHCPLVTQVSVEEGSAAFASENGLLYDASLTTLLRVPAGATDIVIRDGCTTIAAGAMEACASLATITAPASVTSISPDVFTSVPTVSLPAVLAVADDPGASTGATDGSSEHAASAPASNSTTTQITAMVALSSTDDDLPEVDPAGIEVSLAEGALPDPWMARGLNADGTAEGVSSGASLQTAASYSTLDTSGIWLCAPVSKMYYYIYRSSATPDHWVRGDFEVSPYKWTWWEFPADDFSSCLNTSGAVIRRLSGAGLGQINGAHFNHPGMSMWVPWFFIAMDQGNATSVKYGTSPRSLMALGSSDVLSFNVSNMQGQLYISFDDAELQTVDVNWDLGGGASPDASVEWVRKGEMVQPPSVERKGFVFLGWFDASGVRVSDGQEPIGPIQESTTYQARWTQNVDVGFDTSSEPADGGSPGEIKPDQAINVDEGKVEIEDPKRPGYVFQGWTIPNAEGTEAIDQDLVYKDESDGKWYVDASKLPDYANDEGRVELTARWTSVISVDVPSAVTFYADVVTQGNESREGAASSAFGQSKVASQSEVDLRIVGLESTAVATQGSILGADSILKKSDAATPSSSTQKLFSLYPTDRTLTADDLQDPDAVSQAKPANAVDFALDDLLLEKSFAADAFTIPAGDTLNLGYRLNLAETGTELDYDTLATLDEGQSASIANISYTFASEGAPQIAVGWDYNYDGSDPAYVAFFDKGSQITPPSNPVRPGYDFVGWVGSPQEAEGDSYLLDFGTAERDIVYYAKWTDEDMWLGHEGSYYPLSSIKAAANDLSTHASSLGGSQYYAVYLSYLNNATEFRLRVTNDDVVKYYPVHIIGICQDTKLASSGAAAGKAGLTFAFRNAYNEGYSPSVTDGSAWASWSVKTWLQDTFFNRLGPDMKNASTGIEYISHRQQDETGTLRLANFEKVFIPSAYEIWGTTSQNINPAETSTYCFQYQYFAKGGAAFTASPYRVKTNEDGIPVTWWTRTSGKDTAGIFHVALANGASSYAGTQNNHGVVPCFCL